MFCRNPSVRALEQDIVAPDVEAVLIDKMSIQPDLQLDMVAQASAVADISPGVPLVVKRTVISITGKGTAIVAFPIESTRELDGNHPFPILVLIEAQLRLDGPLFEHKGQIVSICLEPGVPVRGDGPLLAKAVDNLLSNAAFYSPEGAQIRVWCGFHEGRPAFSVENTGVHLREESLPRLFEPFYREEGSRNSRTGGSGLGLYLVQMILQKHMASCTIVNTPDGVRAFVLFPADEESSRKNCGDPSLPA